jgi:uncharacterized protein
LSKLLLFLVFVAVVYFVVRGMMRRSRDRTRPRVPPPERMVPCSHCGLNLPQSEALESRGRFYCSDEHRRLSG